MKNLGALIKLDFRLLIPYWKWLILYVGITLLLSIGAFSAYEGEFSLSGYNFMFTFMMFAATLPMLAFESTDKYNMNVLYSTLPSNRKSQVTARYITTVIILLTTITFAILGGIAMEYGFAGGPDWSMFGMFIALAFGMYCIVSSFPMPFMYKIGYTKARIYMWLPIIVFILVINLPMFALIFNVDNPDAFNIFLIMFNNMQATIITSVVVGVSALVISYFSSLFIHQKRDF